jgi:hypothetical protein
MRNRARPLIAMREFENNIRRCARRAAWLIRRNGWYRGSKGRGRNGERCAMVAILDAAEHIAGEDTVKIDQIATVTRYRAEELIDPPGRWRYGYTKYLAYWNDKHGQTASNVLAILARVARGERAPRRTRWSLSRP